MSATRSALAAAASVVVIYSSLPFGGLLCELCSQAVCACARIMFQTRPTHKALRPKDARPNQTPTKFYAEVLPGAREVLQPAASARASISLLERFVNVSCVETRRRAVAPSPRI